MLHGTTPFGVRQHFVESLSFNPLSANAKNRMANHPAAEAVGMRYISPDLPYAIQWMKFDLDDPGKGDHTAARWIDEDLPPPHFIISNPTGRACHLAYGLRVPVDKSPTGRAAPRALFAAVLNGYTRILGADRGYTGVAIKNPMHKSWHTTAQNVPLYDLNTLMSALPASLCVGVGRSDALGEGRNVTLFDLTRFWAYGQIGAAYHAGSFDRWGQAVLREARSENVFTPRLPSSEVQQIARSVAGWTWKNALTLGTEAGKSRKRSDRFSYSRDPLSLEERAERIREGSREGARITHAIQRNRTYDAITGALGTLAGQGVTRPTVGQIATAAGVSVRTVQRFRADTGSMDGN